MLAFYPIFQLFLPNELFRFYLGNCPVSLPGPKMMLLHPLAPASRAHTTRYISSILALVLLPFGLSLVPSSVSSISLDKRYFLVSMLLTMLLKVCRGGEASLCRSGMLCVAKLGG